MTSERKGTIAVLGATGNQGGGVVRALRASGGFRVRALTRNPSKHAGIADEVVKADLNQPETLQEAFAGAHGIFAVTNFWKSGADEVAQGSAAIHAAKDAGIQHFVWSTLPNVEFVSAGRFLVPHFTNKAKVDDLVRSAGFSCHTFVVAPFFYQNFTGVLAPKKREDGSVGWTLPIDASARIHMGDISELGRIVAAAFEQLDLANGAYLPLVGDCLSFGEIVATLNNQGHKFTFNQVPPDVFAHFFPGADELAQMFGYFEQYSYFGGDWKDRIAAANRLVGTAQTGFATWARSNMPAQVESSGADAAG